MCRTHCHPVVHPPAAVHTNYQRKSGNSTAQVHSLPPPVCKWTHGTPALWCRWCGAISRQIWVDAVIGAFGQMANLMVKILVPDSSYPVRGSTPAARQHNNATIQLGRIASLVYDFHQHFLIESHSTRRWATNRCPGHRSHPPMDTSYAMALVCLANRLYFDVEQRCPNIGRDSDRLVWTRPFSHRSESSFFIVFLRFFSNWFVFFYFFASLLRLLAALCVVYISIFFLSCSLAAIIYIFHFCAQFEIHNPISRIVL